MCTVVCAVGVIGIYPDPGCNHCPPAMSLVKTASVPFSALVVATLPLKVTTILHFPGEYSQPKTGLPLVDNASKALASLAEGSPLTANQFCTAASIFVSSDSAARSQEVFL